MSETPTEQNFAAIPDSLSAELPTVDEIRTGPLFEPVAPDSVSRAVPTETFRPSGAAVQTAMIALIFLIIGFIGGALVFGNRGASTAEIEAVVRRAVGEEVAKVSGGASNTASLVDNDPSFGPTDAAVTIVEFSDFYCGFCTRFAMETLPLLRQQYGDQIRFVYRDLPIIGGQVSFDAAVAGNCAADQAKFWEFHDILFANNDARDRSAFIAFAGELGMDAALFTTCLDDKTKQEEVTLDYLDGQGLGITGTPAFFINGRMISGAQPFNTFALVIDAELRKAGITPPERIEIPGA